MTAVDSFGFGEDERTSAKKRRQDSYKKDLQLQMMDQDAARKRERIQGMNVNASGWLDPEKGPERLKPLGGGGFMTDRTNRESKVRPYHMLFNYDRNLGTTSGAPQPYPSSQQDAYNFYATRDIDRPAAHGSFIPPLTIPYVDNRPVIMPGRYDNYPMDHCPRYNPFQNYEGVFRDIKNLIGSSQLGLKNQRDRDNDDHHRRLRLELENERRRLMEQEAEARRRIEDLRREAEERRREWERRLREQQKEKPVERPKTEVVVVRPQSSRLLVDMEEMRRRLADERRKIEEMLKYRAPDYTQVRVVKRPPPPPTPIDPDKADPRNVMDFHQLKHRDQTTRNAFRRVYPEEPQTNMRLENQQKALLLQQEESLSKKRSKKAPPGVIFVEHGIKRPSWLDKTPTPFPHRLRNRDRLYTTTSLNGDIDRMYRKNERRERAMDVDGSTDDFDRFRLRPQRPSSTDTLTDDTWLRPTSATV